MLSESEVMKEHLDKVGGRLATEDLSIVELRERHETAMGQAGNMGISTTARQRATAEVELLAGMIQEKLGPERTPQEEVQRMRDIGQDEAADNLEHNLRVASAQENLSNIEAQTEQLRVRGFSEAYIAEQRRLAEIPLSDILSQPNPVFKAREDAIANRNEVDRLRNEAAALQDASEASLRDKAVELNRQADQLSSNAPSAA